MKMYNILELNKMERGELNAIARDLGIDMPDAKGKQRLLYAILDTQSNVKLQSDDRSADN